MTPFRIDVWSDLACPWCYVGKRRLEAALAGFEHADEVELVWRSFELDPRAPRELPDPHPHARWLAAKYRIAEDEAQRRIDELVATAAGHGLDLRFDRLRPGNTFDGHRLLQLADERGTQGAVKERFMRGYFTEGRALGDHATLRELAVDAGLDAAEVDDVLAGDRYIAEVRADQALAQQLGIRGVPCFVFDRRVGVQGAQPPEVLHKALEQAWSTRAPEPVEAAPAAAAEAVSAEACGPEGCAT